LGAALQADGEYEVRGSGLKHQKEMPASIPRAPDDDPTVIEKIG
jgi:hypothetical protein